MYINLLDKKGGIYMNRKLLTIFIVLAMFFSVSFVTAVHTVGSDSTIKYTNFSSYSYVNSSWIKAGAINSLVNITINISSTNGVHWNVTQINVTIPDTLVPKATQVNSSIEDGVQKWEFVNSTARVFSFNATNGTLQLTNATAAAGPLNWIRFWFNVTANSSITEETQTWTVLTWANNGTVNESVTTTFYTYIDGRAPVYSTMNFTDGTTLATTFSADDYVSNDSDITVDVVVNDSNLFGYTGSNPTHYGAGLYVTKNITSVIMCFNVSDASWNSWNNLTACANLTMVNKTSVESTTTSVVYTATIAKGNFSTDNGNFTFGILVTDRFGNQAFLNNSGAPFVIRADTVSPTATLTAPTDTTIEVQQSIKYTCNGADTSGTSCVMTVTKPDGSSYPKSGCGTIHTLINTETNLAGTYTLSCKVSDGAGKSTTSSSSTFTASYASSSGGGGGGGGSSSDDEEVVDETEGTGEGTATEGTGSEVGTEGTGTETTGEGEVSGEGAGVVKNNLWLWIVLGVVLVGAIVAFVVIKRK